MRRCRMEWRRVHRGPAAATTAGVLAAILGVAALLALTACDRRPPPPSPEVVAEIDGQAVRYGEFEAYVESALGDAGDSLGSDVLSQLFDQFLEERLLARLAVDRGLLPEDAADGRNLRRRAVDALLADAELAEGAVAGEAVEEFYAAHPERFERPPRVRLRQILTEERQLAEEALAEIRAGADFAAVARRLAGEGGTGDAAGGDSSGNGFVGGSLGELSREDLPPAFAEVILELAPGEVSGVVEAEYGFHLFQVTEKLPAETVPLEVVRDEIERELLQRRADRLLAELAEEARRRYDVAVWERNLPFNYRGIYRAEAV